MTTIKLDTLNCKCIYKKKEMKGMRGTGDEKPQQKDWGKRLETNEATMARVRERVEGWN